MTQIEALRLALEALDKLTDVFLDTDGTHGDYERNALDQANKAITAIKAALEAKDEPVLYEFSCCQCGHIQEEEL
jgi:hypothetical protein